MKKILALLVTVAVLNVLNAFAAPPENDKSKEKEKEVQVEDDTPFSYKKCMKRCMKTQNDREKCDFICDSSNGETSFGKRKQPGT